MNVGYVERSAGVPFWGGGHGEWYAGASLVRPYGGCRQILYSHSIVLGGLELTS